jgi:WD40 repeat protein
MTIRGIKECNIPSSVDPLEPPTKKVKVITDHVAEELLSLIFSELSLKDVFCASLVSRDWSSACSDSPVSNRWLWKSLFSRDFFQCNQHSNYKALYRERIYLQNVIRKGKCSVVPFSEPLFLSDLKIKKPCDLCFVEGLVETFVQGYFEIQNSYLCFDAGCNPLLTWDLRKQEKLSMPPIYPSFFKITDDHLLCTGTVEKSDTIDVWNLEEGGKLLHSLQCPNSLLSCRFESRDNYLYVGEASGKVTAWEPRKGIRSYTIDLYKSLFDGIDQEGGEKIFCLKATEDLLIIGLYAGHIVVVDRHTGTLPYPPLYRHTWEISNLSVQRSTLYACSGDGTASAWNLQTGTYLYQVRPDHADHAMVEQIAVQDNTLVTVSDDCTLTLWDGKNGSKLRTLETEEEVIFAGVGLLKIHHNRIYVGAETITEDFRIITWEFQ